MRHAHGLPERAPAAENALLPAELRRPQPPGAHRVGLARKSPFWRCRKPRRNGPRPGRDTTHKVLNPSASRALVPNDLHSKIRTRSPKTQDRIRSGHFSEFGVETPSHPATKPSCGTAYFLYQHIQVSHVEELKLTEPKHCYEISALFPDMRTGTTIRIHARSSQAAILKARQRLRRRKGPTPIALWVERQPRPRNPTS